MTTPHPRPDALQKERRSTPSNTAPRRRMNDIARTNRYTMRLLSARADDPPSAYAATLGGSLTSRCVSSRLPSERSCCRRLVSCLLASLRYLLRFSGRSRPYFLVLSLLPGAPLNHPHYSRNTPAIGLWEFRRNATATRAVCYYISYGGKARRVMTRDGCAT